MKQFIILCLLVGGLQILYAQGNDADSSRAIFTYAQELPANIDSLKIALTKSEDTSKVMILARISRAYTFFAPDSALFYGANGMELAEKMDFKEGEYYCRVATAWAWWSMGDFATAIKLVLPITADPKMDSNGDLVYDANVLMANSYRDEGELRLALNHFFILNAILKRRLKQIPRIQYSVMCQVYVKMNNLDSAEYYLRQAFKAPPDGYGLKGWPYYVAGDYFTARGDSDSAVNNYRTSLQIYREEKNFKDLAGGYNRLAEIFKHKGSIDSSIYYAQQSLTLAQTKKFAKEAMESYVQLSAAYENRNTDSAFYFYKHAISAKDSLFNQDKQRQLLSYQFNEQLRQKENENAQAQYRNKVRTGVLLGTTFVFLLIGAMLWRNNRHKQKANSILQEQKAQTENALHELKKTQTQLVQQEKMASLGELTAGIAHEIQNPLNFVNNFSEVNKDLLAEMTEEIEKGNINEAKQLAKNVIDNHDKINHHGKRADAIVKGMMQHTRTGSGQKEPTDINALCDEYMRLAYHGLRSKDKNFNAKIETDLDNAIGKIDLIPQEIGRAILNIINNAFYAVKEKNKQLTGNGHANYEPKVVIMSKKLGDKIEIRIKDNGIGIPQKAFDKIFQPFFTTKPTGQGTGLGLSLAYDIITKGHGGELAFVTEEGEGTEFIIQLPYKG